MSFPLTFHHRRALTGLLLAGLLACAGCHRDMRDQPRFEPLEKDTFFSNDMSSRPLVPGTVARGHLNEDTAFMTGKEPNGEFVVQVPLELNRKLLDRGRERYTIYCTPCHDRTGSGNGMIVQRGFRRPPSFHLERLREAPAGHFYDVMTKGFGSMPSYAVQIEPRDRWAIVAYVRALQLSQNATIDDVPAAELERLENPTVSPEAAAEDTETPPPSEEATR